MLAVAQHAHGRPIQGFPRVEVIGVPDLDAVVPLLEHGVGFSLTRATTGSPTAAALCKKGAVA
jgi:hypothetical protein